VSSLSINKVVDKTSFYTKPKGDNIKAFDLISVHIEPYRVRFVMNLEYLLAYTGMSTRQYKRRVSSCGVKSGVSAMYGVKNRNVQGFDMIHFAAMADVFKLSIHLLMNESVGHLVESGDLVLEEYGIYRNKFRNKNTRISPVESMAIRPLSTTVTKRLLNPKMDNSNSPCGVFSIFQFTKP
jgi:hypothetical protein